MSLLQEVEFLSIPFLERNKKSTLSYVSPSRSSFATPYVNIVSTSSIVVIHVEEEEEEEEDVDGW